MSLASASDFAHYEEAGASLLARTPAVAMARAAQPTNEWDQMRQHLEQRLGGLRNWRLTWWEHWALLAVNILPRRYHWLVVPNTMSRGGPLSGAIVDPTGTIAMRVCAAGMMSGLMSPSRPWFKLKPGLANVQLDRDAQLWFDECESRIYGVMAGSNFYDSGTQMFEDLVVFGTAPMLIYEDRENVIRCYNPCAGEYYLATGSSFRVQSLYRTFVLTTAQIVEMFGLENCPPEVQSLWTTKGNALENEQVVAHAIEPNFSAGQEKGSKVGVVPGGFTYREYYWLWGKSSDRAMSVRGFRDQPFIAPRWATTSNDAYGRSPAMDALPDILQLQLETRRKAEAIEKMVRPPMLADVSLKNEPSSVLPGHVTYVAGLDSGKGMRPIYEVDPKLDHMQKDLAEIQARVQRWFFNDLFLMISQMEGVQPRNEMEISERRSEKLQVLGPVIEKFQNEGASPAIKRIVAIMKRRNLLPPMPASLRGIPIEIEYISMMALAQRAAATAGMESTLAMAGRMNGPWPGTIDNINPDAFLRDYADKLAFPNKNLNSADDVAKIRAARSKAQQSAAAMAQAKETIPAAADAAKTLSDTNVGEGRNALQMMLGPSGVPNAGALQ